MGNIETRPDNPFDTPEYVQRRLDELFDEKKAKREADKEALIAAEENLAWIPIVVQEKHMPRARERELQEAAERAALIGISNNLGSVGPDKLAEIHRAMNSRGGLGYNQTILKDIRHATKKRYKPGWGRWRNETRKEASEDMKAWIRATGGATLEKTPEEIWAQILADEEGNNST